MHLKLFTFSLVIFLLAEFMPAKEVTYSIHQKTSLAKSYLLGQKKGLDRKLKKAHHKLHLLHLMTPSGLHLSMGLYFFKKFIKRKIVIQCLLLAMIVLTTFLGDYFALRRMAFYGLTKNFMGTFLIDLFLGGFHASPFSYALSFLFIGIILINRDRPKKKLARDFVLAQIIIALFFEQKVYPLGFLIGFFLTPIISFGFPLFLLDFLLPKMNPISNITATMIIFFSKFAGPALSPLPALFIISLCQLPYGFLFLMVAWPSTLQNFPHHLWQKKAFHAPPPKSFQEIKRFSSGYKLIYDNGLICRSRLYSTGWSTRCKM